MKATPPLMALLVIALASILPAASTCAGALSGGPIVLGPDDKPAFPDPPAGFNVKREGIPHGNLEMIEYDSKTVGTKRKMQVYTPPGYRADGYTKDKKYPVLYLLHGIGGDETEWQRFATPNILLDNLIADGKAPPMIVVMPNGRAQKNDRAEGNVMSTAPAFANFEGDLLHDVIPAIEARYSVQADREHRGLAVGRVLALLQDAGAAGRGQRRRGHERDGRFRHAAGDAHQRRQRRSGGGGQTP